RVARAHAAMRTRAWARSRRRAALGTARHRSRPPRLRRSRACRSRTHAAARVLAGPERPLPHPHLFKRAFVLVPLAEIAPNRVIGGVRIRGALDRIDTRGIEKLPPR